MARTKLLFLLVALFALPAQAAFLTWTGAVDNRWSVAGNWSPAAVPQDGDSLSFGASAVTAVNNDIAGLDLASIVIDSNVSYTVTGLGVGISSGITACGSTIAVPIKINANQASLSVRTIDANVNVNGHSMRIGPGCFVTLNGGFDGSGEVILLSTQLTVLGSGSFSGILNLGGEGGGSHLIMLGSMPNARVTGSNALSGTGLLGDVTTRGNIAPGTSSDRIGTLRTGDFTHERIDFTPELEGELLIDIGNTSDRLSVTGTVTLNTMVLIVTVLSPPTDGETFVIINNDGTDPVNGILGGSWNGTTRVPAPEGSIIISGAHRFRISYVGGTGNDVTLTATVQKADTTTNLTASKPYAPPGDPVQFAANVFSSAGTPTGTVSFFDGATLLGTVTLNAQARAVLTHSFSTPGAHQIKAVYNGATEFNGSTSNTLNFWVGDKWPTYTTLTSSPNPSDPGQPVRLKASVSTLDPVWGGLYGDFTFYRNGVVIGTVSAIIGEITVSTLPPGPSTLTVTYHDSGPHFADSTSPPVTHIVRQHGTQVTASAGPLDGGSPGTINVTVTPSGSGGPSTPPTGTVTVREGSTTLGSATLANGSASVPIEPLGVGTHVLTVNYSGDANYGPSSTTITINVESATPTLSIAMETPAAEGSTAAVRVILSIAQTSAVVVSYRTSDETAIAGEDYLPLTGTLTFEPGETSKTINVSIAADTKPEQGETFHVNLSNAQGARIGRSRGTVIIANDDPFFTVTNAVQYDQDDPSQVLTLRIPTTGQAPFPLVIAIETDDWAFPDADASTAARQANRGYAVATLSFRSSRTDAFPAQLLDVQEAIRWLRANAARLNLDPTRFALWGIGAGGHLAALAGTSSDDSTRVQAVVTWYAQTDFLQLNAQALEACGQTPVDHDDASSPESLLLGCPVQSCPDAAAAANPATHASPDDPPFLIMHGDSDCEVPLAQATLLYDALRAAGVDARLHVVPGGLHGGALWQTPATNAVVDAFLDEMLRNPRSKRRAVR
jgi:acetyl esterase/lipase